MRYIILYFLFFISQIANGQIRARQLRADSLYTTLQVITNDTATASSGYRLGRWRNVEDLFTGYGDTDWYKFGGTAIPANHDSAYRVGVTEIRDTAGVDGKITLDGRTITMNNNGHTSTNDDYYLKMSAYDSENPVNFNIVNHSATNAGGGKNIESLGMGWNLAPGGGRENSSYSMLGLLYEYNWKPDSRIIDEFHLLHTDVGGTARRPMTWFFPPDTALWELGVHVPTVEFREVNPGSSFYFSTYYTADNNRSNARFADPDGSGGVHMFVDVDDNFMYWEPYGLTNPWLYTNAFYSTEVNRLQIDTPEGNPDRLLGWNSTQKWVGDLILGFGFDISNDTLNIDTTQVGGGGGSGGANLSIEGSGPTYTINSSSGNDVYVTEGAFIALSENAPDTLVIAVDTSGLIGVLADADFFELGTTMPPQAITDTMYHTGITGIGENTASAMYGQLTIGTDGGATRGVVINGYNDTYIPLTFSMDLTEDNTWEFAISDTWDFGLRNVIGGTPTVPFFIDAGAVTGINIQADGDVQMPDYPNTRDDGTAANFLGTDANGVIQSYDIDDVISEWYLVGESTPGSEAITDGETVTLNGSGITTVTRTGSTIDINSVEVDGSTTNEAWTIDGDLGGTEVISSQTVLFAGAGINSTNYNAATNTLTITGTEVDGSTTNELNTIEEGNVTVQTGNSTIDFQTLFDVATDGAGEVNVSLDLGEATTVSTAETDDYMIMWDQGLAQHQKMLWTDYLIDLITFREDNTAEGTGNSIDVLTGLDLLMSGAEANISLDFNEFTTDAAPEGDEFIILYDPSAGTQEKTLITAITDTNFAEDNLTFTGNRTHDMNIYSMTLHGDVNTFTLLDDNGGTGDNFIIASELGAGSGVTGGISFEYQNGGSPTDQFDLEANKRSSTKQTFEIQAEQGTDAHITYEKNSNHSANTTQSHLSVNAGVAFTQNYEWTATSADLTLDRSFYNVIVSGSGAIGDQISLPEIELNGDNWSASLQDGKVQVGQVYVISNFRASTGLEIVPFAGDNINGSGSAVTLAAGKSLVIRAVRLSAGTGYWQTWTSD